MNSDSVEYESLLVKRENGVGTITLNRPHRRNAMTFAAWDELDHAIQSLSRSDLRVIVITGAGSAFCAGGDLAGPDRTGHPLVQLQHVSDTCAALLRAPQPTVARVNGPAMGAGMNLALACDLVVASREARFGQVFAHRGLSIDFGGSWLLPRIIGLQRAKELALLGDVIDAEHAFRLGLVSRLVDADALDDELETITNRLKEAAPIAVRLIKRLLDDGLGRSLEEALSAEAQAQALSRGTYDAAEGAAAFLERRPPRYEGR